MELNHLKVFFEVAKIGRFTEAARRLHISQSALSRSVALLEESEGVKLFDRTKRGVTLTAVGHDVFKLCEQLFQTVTQIEHVCRGTNEVCEGTLRFSTTDHITNDLLVEPIQAFRHEFPLVVPSIFTAPPDEIAASLLNTESEFGLLFTKVPLPQLDYVELRAEPMALVVQTELWRTSKSGSNAATMKRLIEKVGYIASIGASTQARPSRVLKELFGEMPRIGFEANGQEAQKRFCLAGGGIAYLARFMVEREIKSGTLHEIAIESPHIFKLWLATNKGRALSLSAKTFIDRLRSSLAT